MGTVLTIIDDTLFYYSVILPSASSCQNTDAIADLSSLYLHTQILVRHTGNDVQIVNQCSTETVQDTVNDSRRLMCI